jgi:hypothetical protein
VTRPNGEPTLLAGPQQPPPASGHQDDRTGAIEIDLPSGARIRVDASVNEMV